MNSMKSISKFKLIGFILFFALAAPRAQSHQVISYVTDLEGSKTRFLQFMTTSNAFYLGKDGAFHIKDGAIFVFGGDAPDRYLGSQWVVQELLRLKLESPQQVVLIAGNRDINKMRLPAELSAAAMQKPAYRYHFIDQKDPQWLSHQGGDPRSKRLQFILARTMGAPHAFQLRRQELNLADGPETSEVNELVAQSFLDELAPTGAFAQFLSHAQLAWRSGSTLFVHGGVTIENLGLGPRINQRIENIDQWISTLNSWYQTEVQNWIKTQTLWSGDGARPSEMLLEYPMPRPGEKSKPESVVCARNSNDKNDPLLPAPEVIQWLLRQGIHRVVLGHTPTGHVPVFVRTPDGQFEIISADNSYAPESFASQVEFDGLGNNIATARAIALSPTGTPWPVYAVSKIGEPSLLGQRAPDDAIIVGRNENSPGSWITFQHGEKFKIINKSVSENELKHPCESVLFPKQTT